MGMDYSDTFSPVAKLTFVSLFISLTTSQHWPSHELDIKNAIIPANLKEELFIGQPLGFVSRGSMGKFVI